MFTNGLTKHTPFALGRRCWQPSSAKDGEDRVVDRMDRPNPGLLVGETDGSASKHEAAQWGTDVVVNICFLGSRGCLKVRDGLRSIVERNGRCMRKEATISTRTVFHERCKIHQRWVGGHVASDTFALFCSGLPCPFAVSCMPLVGYAHTMKRSASCDWKDDPHVAFGHACMHEA